MWYTGLGDVSSPESDVLAYIHTEARFSMWLTDVAYRSGIQEASNVDGKVKSLFTHRWSVSMEATIKYTAVKAAEDVHGISLARIL
jgi:hypothetical protein